MQQPGDDGLAAVFRRLIASTGHLLITRAYELAEAPLLAPLAYTEMIMATVVGWAFFGDFPDGWTLLGVAILVLYLIFLGHEWLASILPSRWASWLRSASLRTSSGLLKPISLCSKTIARKQYVFRH